jgi:hypothetical protein
MVCNRVAVEKAASIHRRRTKRWSRGDTRWHFGRLSIHLRYRLYFVCAALVLEAGN